MISSPVDTLEQRATVIDLLGRFQSDDAPHADTQQHAPFGSRQIVMVRANRICRRRSPSALDLDAVGGSSNGAEAGRGWRKGAAWDAIDGRSISERLNAAAAGGIDALALNRKLVAAIQDAVLDVRCATDGAADDAGREVPVLV
jgi:hypothetical protein